MIITCYKGATIAQGFVANTYEVDENFTGIIIDNLGVKKKLHHPWKLHIYDDGIVIKDVDGKSYKVDPSLVEDHNTNTKLLAYLRDCIDIGSASEYYQEFYPAGDEITLGYDLTDFSLWTKDSINDSFTVILQGLNAYYDSAAFVAGNNIQFRILAGNKLKFARAQGSKRVQVQIKNKFVYA